MLEMGRISPETHMRTHAREYLLRYEEMHKAGGFEGEETVYYVISSLVKGLKSVDIACGEGWIEQKSLQTVGVDFSVEALHNARRNGALYLIRATAEHLPFRSRVFDVSICLGSLEHFVNPFKALKEMRRISYIQILTVHAELPFPLSAMRKVLSRLLLEEGQPIEHRFKYRALKRMIEGAGLNIVIRGYQDNVALYYLWQGKEKLQRLAKRLKLPDSIPLPSHHFIISVGSKSRPESCSKGPII